MYVCMYAKAQINLWFVFIYLKKYFIYLKIFKNDV